MSCAPPYAYRPDFTPGTTGCTMPRYNERRSRSGTILDPYDIGSFPGDIVGVFIRSRGFGTGTNLITVEMTTSTFVVTKGTTVENYTLSSYGNFSILAAALTLNNSIVEIMPISVDIYDTTRTQASTNFFAFGPVTLSGGDGQPDGDIPLNSIRTGPERSLIIVASTEDYQGNVVPTPQINVPRVRQWDGSTWIQYSNLIPGSCPLNGT